ncbi:hypothetical protein [Spirosoma validum]|uniref:Uncharacterized protein n=1 Tax=Spirosoma validum TaxID=2771355 RepID=A0A927GHD3_9BACT|nr:hypothetical protein [Spirosoma validum]MBD2757826.1 hypothetical protein [Spirosoma validum]
MRVVLEVNDSEWDFLAELLKKFQFVRIQRTEQTEEVSKLDSPPRFEATQLNTQGFTFNRQEANER